MIKTVGEPKFTERGREVLAFHLHRYLAHWLAKSGTDRVHVTVGWEHGTSDEVTVQVGRRHSSCVEVAWTFGELCDARRQGTVVVGGGDVQRRAVPICEGDAVIAFVVVDGELPLQSELEIHVAEAIGAARRNGVRLLFDECDDTDMKSVLYDVLDHLPEWSGCDVAAACVLANSLEAMAVDDASEADFYVMAERLYCSDDVAATRLVGLSIDTRDEIRTVVDSAIERLREGGSQSVVRFDAVNGVYTDPSGREVVSIGAVSGRPDDAFSLVVPIVAESDEHELIGLLCLAFSTAGAVPPSVAKVLTQVGAELGRVLRHSPLYTLSASRLRLVREVRSVCERHIAGPLTEATRDAIVRDVVDLVERASGVPAFSVGYTTGVPRKLRYSASYGWTDFDAIELDVDVDDDAYADSGVSALAARLGRPVVLAGGRPERDHQEFKNFLWVHEESGRIFDVRAPGQQVEGEAGWTRLGAYYKPARLGAYATVAHPIKFASEVLGVVALEVDRDTEWTWWAGYGAQLLWELVSSELAFAFWTLDRQLHG